MNKLPEVTNIKFHPSSKQEGSFVGYISFSLDNGFKFSECSLHKRAKGSPAFRVLYTENKFGSPVVCPTNKQLQHHIDEEISAYLLAQLGV